MNGETLYRSTPHFRPFPNPSDVFANQVEKHAQHFLPLATVDLASINPEWQGPVHFVMPIEPYSGVIGENREPYHNHLCRENWVAFHIEDGRYQLACDFQFFKRDAMKAYYDKVHSAYRMRFEHFQTHGCLHHLWAEPDELGHYPDKDRVDLVAELGGEPLDGNWSNMANFPIAKAGYYRDDEGDAWDKCYPLTEDGRHFSYIGTITTDHYVVPSCDYLDCGGADMLLFYDPKDQVALITFDWT